NEIGGTEITANDRTVCSACHTNASTSFPAGEAQREAGTGYLTDGTWPGDAVYNTAWNAVARTGSAHLTALGGGGSSLPGIYAAGDCKICHDVHGTANTYDELRLTFTDAQFTICFDCHDSDGTSSVDIKQYYPPAAGGTNGGDRAGHQVVTSVVGANLALGEAIPCYDCHNPHGSQSAHMLQVRDIGDGAGEIDVSSDDGVRKFCFACHATSDTAEGWTGSAWADITGATVEGFERDGSDGSVLRLPNVNGHRKADAQSCYQCHGNDATNNVHNPTGGISDGGQDCYGCHSAYQSPMEDGIGAKTGATRANFYHHVLGSATNDGDKAFAAGSYPTSTSDVYCLSCHVDHDKFNATKAANLRDALGSSPGTSTADYSSATDSGICTECHASSLAKQSPGTDQKDDESTATPKIVPGSGASQFGASAHDYYATSTYGDATTFNANCSKCHNDEQTKDFQTSTYRFGVHWSAARRILSALGGTVTDPLQEQHCYRCHSATGDGLTGNKTVANRDWYDATAMGTASERVYQQFQKTSAHPVVAAGGDSVECESCHNAHVVTTGNTKVTDPDNTYNAYTYTDITNQPTYCLKCHDGALPTYIVDGTTYRPYAVTQADTALNNKSTYAARGHWSTAGSISAGERRSCAVCHENHGSDYPKLLGAYDVATSSNRINGTAITGNNNTVCSACHSAASTSFPAFTREAVTGYPTDGTWPGDAVYNTAWNAVTHTGSGHLGANGGGTSTLPSKFAGSCNVCHNVHGTANTYDELNLALAKQNFAVCFDCHDSDGPAARNIKTYYPVAAGGSGGGSGHEIVSDVVGANLALGEALPCYDCHNPHGTSSSSYGLLVVTMTDGSTTIVLGDGVDEIKMSPADQSTAANVRNFCFCCHTTSDTSKGWNGSALAVVVAGAQVEGFDRTTGSQLRLPARSGHREADNQSCYVCHGDDYSGLSTNNVHNPSGGVSEGGTDCYACHSTYQTYMEDGLGTKTGASRATVYHHVMGSATNEGDRAFGFGSYPTSETDLYCLSCHVDHDRFNASMSSNLRQTINGPSPAATDSDYLTSGTFGVCVNCHDTSLSKQVGTDQKDDGSTATPVIAGGTGAGGFGNSAHQYTTTSSFGDATTFKANCSKCHNDENNPAYKDFQTSTNRFGIHWSATRRILSALGGAVADPLQESHCYRCHSRTTDGLAGTKKSVAGRDWYDAANMTAASERVYAQFQLTSKHPVVAAGGDSVECESCHNAHVVTTSAIVTDPDNTYNAYTYTDVTNQPTYCLKCHDGVLPTYVVDGTTYRPYAVTQADTALNNKSTYAARGHWSTAGSISAGERQSCAACHDNHGSNAPKLLGAYDMVDSRNEINGSEITANDNTVCTACHTGASTSYPTFTREAVTGYPMDGTWPGNAVYIGANGIHRGDADGQDVIWPSSGYADGDCKNCHDVHGTANTYDELRGTFENADFGNCFACHDGDPSNINIKQYYPVANGGTAVQTAQTNFGHKIQVPTGTLTAGEGLPCYDCHNPHGNANSPDGLLVQTMTDGSTTIMVGDAAGEIDMSSGASRRRFCFACHTTADTTAGWNGSSYAVVGAGALVEGIDRTVYDAGNKRGLKLPPVSGHNQADGQDCYGCHGSDYTGATTNNVHNPGPGGSNGGINCLNCHGASSSERYDRMISDTGYYHHVLDSATPGNAPNTGTYPTSETVLECVSCHTDHNYFNSNKGANLRNRINDTAGTASNQDFVAGGSGANNYDDGICLSCHYAARTKSSSQKTANASAQTLAMSATNYDVSLHDYEVNNSALVGYGTSAFRANCTKCHDDEQETLKTYQSGTYKIGTHYSAEARIAKALGAALTASGTATEENLCYECHSTTANGFKSVANRDGYNVIAMTSASEAIYNEFNTRTNRHPVATFSGRHKADEGGSSNWNPASSRHVECEDCHNPHEARTGITAWPDNTSERGSTAPAIAGSNLGVWGVGLNGSNWSWAGMASPNAQDSTYPTYSRLTTSGYQWQLCLKCHSTYAWGTTAPTVSVNLSGQTGGKQTDVGEDFSPTQLAYHPLFATGLNQPAVGLNSAWNTATLRRNINGTSSGNGLSNTFTDGWRTTSIVVCSDCHGSSDAAAPSGPHGSDNRWLLQGLDPNIKITTVANGTETITQRIGAAAVTASAANFCLNCHRPDVYGWNNTCAPNTDAATLSRFSHSTMSSSCYQTAQFKPAALQWSSCLHCHGGRKDNSSYLSPANTVVQSGAVHGTSMGTGHPNATYTDNMGPRFMNGASWSQHKLGNVDQVVGCFNFNSKAGDPCPAATDSYSSCTKHTPNTYAANYAY
ncbi:MAG: hypothetical protein OEV43_05940, partial [Coriobacteriia bacterium]|nr:hypothetical protein [Coriobacteriia bacterium]